MNFAQYLRSLQILFIALLAGQVIVCTVLYFVYEPQEVTFFFREAWLEKVWPLVLIALIAFAFFLNRRKLESARSNNALSGKLADYRIASIMKWAMTEGSTLISALIFFESGKEIFLVMAGTTIAYFATQFPSRSRLVNELDLSANEQMTLDDPSAVVFESPR